jgi:hypothetical protein
MYPFRPALVALISLCITAATAETVAPARPPSGTILTVIGLNENTFSHGQVEFTLEQLQGMEPSQITTSSIWTEGPHRFTGVMLRTLIEELQIEGQTLRLHALNDYTADLPISETTAEAPMLAYLIDGAPMPVRDKGPIWVIYPYDSSEAFRSIETFDRSVWQLDRIEVLP